MGISRSGTAAVTDASVMDARSYLVFPVENVALASVSAPEMTAFFVTIINRLLLRGVYYCQRWVIN